MRASRENALALRDARRDAALLRIDSAAAAAGVGAFPLGLFCAAPTVLEAINRVLREQGLSPLWAHADGTIGPADPLLLRIEYVPSPFVC